MIDYKLHTKTGYVVKEHIMLLQLLSWDIEADFVDLYQKCQPLLQEYDRGPSFSFHLQRLGCNGGAIRNLS